MLGHFTKNKCLVGDFRRGMVQCLLWLEFEITKLDLVGNDLGIGFYRGFSVNANGERIDKLEIYELASFEVPVLLAVGDWLEDRWNLTSKHNNAFLKSKIDRTFERVFIPYRWI